MPATVLIVEDDFAVRGLTANKLESHGLHAVCVRTFADALTICASKEPIDLIWINHYLLGLDEGPAFITAVKTVAKRTAVPIYVVSESLTQEQVDTYVGLLGIQRHHRKADHAVQDILLKLAEPVAA